jgi:transposase-like protein
MLTMTNAYPMEFRRDVVQVARHREPGVSLEKIAADFGIHPITLSTWLKKADIEDGVKPGITSAESAELREANKRIRLLEQEAEVLKRALAYVSQGALPGNSITRS